MRMNIGGWETEFRHEPDRIVHYDLNAVKHWDMIDICRFEDMYETREFSDSPGVVAKALFASLPAYELGKEMDR